MRKTGKEILEYCEDMLHSRGETVQTLCNATGMSSARIFMWKSKETIPRIDTLVRIADYLGITIDELIGMKAANEIPEVIRYCENMLKKIPEEQRDIIAKIIHIFYESVNQDNNTFSKPSCNSDISSKSEGVKFV